MTDQPKDIDQRVQLPWWSIVGLLVLGFIPALAVLEDWLTGVIFIPFFAANATLAYLNYRRGLMVQTQLVFGLTLSYGALPSVIALSRAFMGIVAYLALAILVVLLIRSLVRVIKARQRMEMPE